MLILFGLIALLVAGLVLQAVGGWDWSGVGFMTASVGGVGLVVGLVLLPVLRSEGLARVEAFRATKLTIERARLQADSIGVEFPIESVAILGEIARHNAWLAAQKYWNRSLFDIWIPDAVEELEPIL